SYPNSSTSFSFALRTWGPGRVAQLQLTRRQLGGGAYTGMYLCVESNSSTTIGLRGATHSCPLTLLPDGSLRLCNGRSPTLADTPTAPACPRGTCSCPPPYAPPDNWVMVPGLGFEDCSASLQPLQPTPPPPPPAPPSPWQPATAAVTAQAAGAWAFFRLDLPSGSEAGARGWAELSVTAVAASQGDAGGSLLLLLRYQQLPSGEGPGQYDLTSDPTLSSSSSPASSSPAPAAAPLWSTTRTARLSLSRSDPAFRPGTWYLGVLNRGPTPLSCILTAAVYGCPNNCSGRGACAADTGTCTCSDSGQQPSSSPDCSSSSSDLSLGQNLTAAPSAFAYDRIILRGVRQQLRSAATSHLRLTAAFTTASSTGETGAEGELPGWVTARPVVLVAPSANTTSAGGGFWPDAATAAAARMSLSEPRVAQSMDVGSWMISPEDDSLHLLLLNPLAGLLQAGNTSSSPAAPAPAVPAAPAPLHVGYWVVVEVVGSCLANCSGHGACDTGSGLCVCQPGYGGGDCSVNLATNTTVGGVCAPGSFRPRHVDASRGTCWEACAADGSGFEEGGCSDFTCDEAGSSGGGEGQQQQGRGPLRRRGGAEECVSDACVAGNYTLVDEEGGFACVRRCSCPADGGACGLEEGCVPGTVRCLGGRSWDASGERCVESPCVEG
ncbi:hypothetical protein Agub_g15941, partial [Astrephomene gubernaculifera]